MLTYKINREPGYIIINPHHVMLQMKRTGVPKGYDIQNVFSMLSLLKDTEGGTGEQKSQETNIYIPDRGY